MNRQHPKLVKPLRKGGGGMTASAFGETGFQFAGDYPKATPLQVHPRGEISKSNAAAKQEGLL